MFDIGAGELLVVVIVAIIVIGPKELPLALRTAGRWIGKIRRVSAHFRSGIDAMIREAEMEEMDRKWKEQNEKIMAKYPAEADAALVDHPVPAMEPLKPDRVVQTGAEARIDPPPPAGEEPPLPFDKPAGGS